MSTILAPRAPRPDPALDELRAEVRAFLADELAEGRWTPHDDSWLRGWDPRFSAELGRRGWLGMTLPREYGGAGRTALERYVVTEELVAAGAPVAAHWVADRQAAPSLLRYGTEEQRRRFLPRIAAGEYFFGIGMSEPDAGSDLAAVRTRAERVDGGWELTGTKVWTSGAHRAHAFVVLARSAPPEGRDRHVGLSQFVVEFGGPGIDVRPIRLLTGGHHFNEVVLDRAFVPDSMVLGELGAGWAQVTGELAFERSGPERFLSTVPLLAATVAELARRGDDRHAVRVGELVARLWTLRQLSMSVAAGLQAGDPVDVAAALVKDLGTRFEGDVVDVAVSVLGIEPDPLADDGLARMLADALLHSPGFTLRGGTNEVLRGVVARGLGMR
ncbi:acyl-CoA dehydrogenase family protein [Trujillonella humicola]|uniref:acyl-CoA dehydrogenase family protein n=1 Tax=Trujillonella humicola TaxID=3383699 RepID=UPI003905CE8F